MARIVHDPVRLTSKTNSTSFESTSTYEGRKMVVRVKLLSQDLVNNTSTIQWTLSTEGGESQYYTTGATILYLYNGSSVYKLLYNKARTAWDTHEFPASKGSTSGTVTIKHNTNGELNLSFELTTAIYKTTQDTDVLGISLKLEREISITSAPNFNDEDNPTVTYTNQAGDKATSLTMQIVSEDSKTIFATRSITKTSTSYTFSLTDTERTNLRKACTTNSMTVKFKLISVIGGDTLTKEVKKTFTIVNGSPTISATVTLNDTKTATLTGNANTLIKHYSSVKYTFTPTSRKNSTIVESKVSNGSQWNTALSGTFNNVDSGLFTFYTKDSRGNVTSYNISRTIVDYILLTCNLEMNSPNTDGELTFKIFGNYWNGNFGSVANTLTVQYRYQVNEGEYGSWTSVTPTVANGVYSVNVQIKGLNYRDAYRFQARAIDKLNTIETLHFPTKTRPVFDWGENDFNFNCPVTITDGYLKYPLMGIINAMTKTYVCDVTTFAGDNYTVSNAGATICGNILRCNFTVTRNTATGSGNIANETVLTLSIAHGGKISNMLNVCFSNGANGNVASFLTSNVSQTYETLDFNVQLSATGGATTEFSTYFQVPITINLDKFVEE